MPRKLSMEPDELRYYILKHAGKKSVYQMYLDTGIAPGTIRNYASDMEVSVEVQENLGKRELVINAIIVHGESKNAKEIAAMLGVSLATVRSKAWQLGLPIKPMSEKHVVVAGNMDKEKMFNVRARENWLI